MVFLVSELTGDLAAFGTRPVLAFLAQTAKTGELRIASDDIDGRVLLQGGSVAYATTATGSDTVQELDSLLERHAARFARAPLEPMGRVNEFESAWVRIAYGGLE